MSHGGEVKSILTNELASIMKDIEGCKAFDECKYDLALECFNKSHAVMSKVAYNIGIIFQKKGEPRLALQWFEKALAKDKFLAIAWYQAACIHFKADRPQKAAVLFANVLKLMRGNSLVDYRQLGLDTQLYSCEICYNWALCLIRGGRVRDGLIEMTYAVREKKHLLDHQVIDEALEELRNCGIVSKESLDRFYKTPSTTAILACREANSSAPLTNLAFVISKYTIYTVGANAIFRGSPIKARIMSLLMVSCEGAKYKKQGKANEHDERALRKSEPPVRSPSSNSLFSTGEVSALTSIEKDFEELEKQPSAPFDCRLAEMQSVNGSMAWAAMSAVRPAPRQSSADFRALARQGVATRQAVEETTKTTVTSRTIVKLIHKERIKRTVVTGPLTFDRLCERARCKLGLGPGAVKLSSLDREGDLVDISEDEDVDIALQSLEHDRQLRIYVDGDNGLNEA